MVSAGDGLEPPPAAYPCREAGPGRRGGHDASGRRPRAAIVEAMPEIQRAAERYYLRGCPDLRGKHCPGVEPVLKRLTRRGVLLGL